MDKLLIICPGLLLMWGICFAIYFLGKRSKAYMFYLIPVYLIVGVAVMPVLDRFRGGPELVRSFLLSIQFIILCPLLVWIDKRMKEGKKSEQ